MNQEYTKRFQNPYFVLEYVSNYVTARNGIQYSFGTDTTSVVMKAVKDSNTIDIFTDKQETALAIANKLKLTQVMSLMKTIEGNISSSQDLTKGDIFSNLPGDIGRKLESISFKDTVKSCSTLQLDFSGLSKDEADYPCFNRGSSFTFHSGYRTFTGKPVTKISFAGCVQTSGFSYTASGIKATLLLATEAYTKLEWTTPFDITTHYSEFYDAQNPPNDSPQDNNIHTFYEFLKAAKKYLGIVKLSVVCDASPDYVEKFKNIYGIFDEPYKSSDPAFTAAKNFMDQVRIGTQRAYKDIPTGNITYTSIKDVLNYVASCHHVNWFLTCYGELIFGILYDSETLAKKFTTKKVFWHRPFLKGLGNSERSAQSGGMFMEDPLFRAGLDEFENFEIVEVKQSPKAKPSTASFDIGLNKMEEPDYTADNNGTIPVQQSIKSDSGLDVVANNDTQIRAKTIKKEVQGVDSGSAENADFSNIFDEVTSNAQDTVGKITKARGDASIGIANLFYFRGTNKHTGHYFITEIEHKWSKDSTYTMDITGVKPTNLDAIPDNQIQQEAYQIVLGNGAVKDKAERTNTDIKFNDTIDTTNNYKVSSELDATIVSDTDSIKKEDESQEP